MSWIWRDPTNHVTDCYFCVVPPFGANISDTVGWEMILCFLVSIFIVTLMRRLYFQK